MRVTSGELGSQVTVSRRVVVCTCQKSQVGDGFLNECQHSPLSPPPKNKK